MPCNFRLYLLVVVESTAVGVSAAALESAVWWLGKNWDLAAVNGPSAGTWSSLLSFVGCSCRGSVDAELQAVAVGDGPPGLKSAVRLVLVVMSVVVVEVVAVGEVVVEGVVAAVKPVEKW
jgi:hypothetical protein